MPHCWESHVTAQLCIFYSAGYYCEEGATRKNPTNYGLHGGAMCSSGYYCPEGSPRQIECPGGMYCSRTRLSEPSGNCTAGMIIIFNQICAQRNCFKIIYSTHIFQSYSQLAHLFQNSSLFKQCRFRLAGLIRSQLHRIHNFHPQDECLLIKLNDILMHLILLRYV